MQPFDTIPVPDPAEARRHLIDPAQLPPDHRSGFVALVGRPNVGKSTLMNRLIGERLAIVTRRPQTTRRRMLGILTRAEAQILFVDTPGLHEPADRLGRSMVRAAERALRDADLIVPLLDATRSLRADDRRVLALVQRAASARAIPAINKVDRASPEQVAAIERDVREALPAAAVFRVSALTGAGLDALVAALIERLPQGPRYYPEEQIGDWQLRDLAAELVREQVLLQLRHELPYSVEVWLDEWVDQTPALTLLRATLFVERESQKGIVIGKNGQMLKEIAGAARSSLGEFIGHAVELELRVKVQPRWRQDDAFLRRLGFD